MKQGHYVKRNHAMKYPTLFCSVLGLMVLVNTVQSLAGEIPPQVILTMEAKSEAVYCGEPLPITVHATNVSDKAIVMPILWNSEHFKIKWAHQASGTGLINPFPRLILYWGLRYSNPANRRSRGPASCIWWTYVVQAATLSMPAWRVMAKRRSAKRAKGWWTRFVGQARLNRSRLLLRFSYLTNPQDLEALKILQGQDKGLGYLWLVAPTSSSRGRITLTPRC